MSTEKIVNGVNVDQLFNAIDLFKEKPELAEFKFRATNTWIEGTHCRATVKDFYGPGQEDTSREPRSFDLDEPIVLLGKAEGTNPVEYLLVALSGCLTTLSVAAIVLGLQLDGMPSYFTSIINRNFDAILRVKA